ncbi:RdgB/HAM1 family non-canonical purine NTP pyrophosphatase [soil metagenome]
MTGRVLPLLVCASANPGKVAEIVALSDGVVDLRPRPPEVPDVVEDADTLVGNARLKAVAICEATQLAAVADDTGLEVHALGGRPGVRSARYAGEGCTDADNRAKLLAELAELNDRRAQFRTSVLVHWPDGRELVVDGVCEGTIAPAERGDRGFGYDRLFVPLDGDGRTFAEMSEREKNAVSHRGRAFRALFAELSARIGAGGSIGADSSE